MPVLWGRDSDLFENSRDLIALAPVDTDRLNVFLKSYFGWFLKVSNQRSWSWTMCASYLIHHRRNEAVNYRETYFISQKDAFNL